LAEKQSQETKSSEHSPASSQHDQSKPSKEVLAGNESRVETDPVAIKQVTESIVKALSYFGSKQVVESILQILEQEHSFAMRDILRNPKGFRVAVEGMFGEGSHVIDKIVCIQLARDLKIRYEGIGLEELIALFKARMEAKES
jgi:hypothetical protein